MSRLLGAEAAAREEYQALNRLTLEAFHLVLTTYPKDPPELLILENVPGIMSRGAELLAQIRSLLTAHGYRLHESTHDCGELGGLGQHRRRFLMVARLERKLPAYLYQPPKQRVKACGEIIGPLPLPNDPAAGDLHRLPRISWINWVRLALIPPGGDWRATSIASATGRIR
jgi:site-specific DNA-cytosine methylase